MSDQAAVSTRQASALLGVHESSVKRWCSAGDLSCDRTEGGHRRIALQDLAAFCTARGLPFALDDFGEDAADVWTGTRALQRNEAAELVALLYQWVKDGCDERIWPLTEFLRVQGVTLPAILDTLLAPVMHRIGFDYHAGFLSIGDEHRMTHLIRDLLVQFHLNARSSAPLRAGPLAVVGCARGEVHELGALMTRALLEDSGWRVVYLGLNVPTEEFARQQREHKASLVCISMVPPVGRHEALVMMDVLAHLYDSQHPYHLVFGGQALGSADERAMPDSPHLAVEAFNRMEPFAQWVHTLAAP